MARSTPTINNSSLHLSKKGQETEIDVGSEQWFAWLREESSTIFSFVAPEGTFTARKERAGSQRGGWYWKAYRKSQGKQYRVYLGKTEDLTLDLLKQAARTLVERIQTLTDPQISAEREQPQSPQKLPNELTAQPLLTTRLHIPRLPSLQVERTQLLPLLDAGQKLTLVHASAGFGKTTLIAQWIAYRRIHDGPTRFAWLTLESGDNDPIRFWSSIITACQTLFAHRKQALQTRLSQLSRSPFSSTSLQTVLTLLLNDLADITDPGVLILEDYHLIEQVRIHETLAFFIEHLPSTQRIVILTRRQPPLPLVRWRARGDLLEIAGFQLRFSEEETTSFLQQALPRAFSPAAAHSLHSQLEGWPAGIRLLALSLQGHQTPQALNDALDELHTETSGSGWTHHVIQDFFLNEIFNAQPEPLQLFLLQTSLLSRLTSSLCDAITGRQDSDTWLKMIERSGFFLETLDTTGRWYRYHPLWASTMRTEATRRLGPTTLRNLSLQASHWYAEHAMPVEAIEAALAAHDFEYAASLITQLNTKTYFSQYHTLKHWIEQLPPSLLDTQPTLCFLLAQARIFSGDLPGPLWNIEPVDDLLCLAEDGWRKQNNQFQVGILYAFRATFTLVHGRIDEATTYAHQALQLLPAPDVQRPYAHQPTEWIEWHCGCLMALGLASAQTGSYAQAYPLLLDGYTLSLHCHDRVFTRIMGWHLGDTCCELGKLHQAAAYYQQTLHEPIAENEVGEHILRANALAGLIRLAYEGNELARAEQLLNELSHYTYRGDSSFGEEALHTKIEVLRALLLFAQGNHTEAQKTLSGLLVRQQANPHALYLPSAILIWQARLQLRLADLAGAGNTLNTLATTTQNLPPLQQEARQLLLARLSLARGDADTAFPLLTQLLTIVEARQHLTRAIEIQLLLVLAHAINKQRSTAHQLLINVLARTCNEGFKRIFLDEGELLASLLRSLLSTLTRASVRTYAHNILQAFSNPDDASTPALLEPLSKQEQRVLTLLVAGRSNPEIAEELVISINTVKGHIKHIYHKLNVTGRVEASEAARHLHLI